MIINFKELTNQKLNLKPRNLAAMLYVAAPPKRFESPNIGRRASELGSNALRWNQTPLKDAF